METSGPSPSLPGWGQMVEPNEAPFDGLQLDFKKEPLPAFDP